jgi:putative ABC transport system permease protein
VQAEQSVRTRRRTLLPAAAFVVMAIALLAAPSLSRSVPEPVAFFCSGSLLLMGALVALRTAFHGRPREVVGIVGTWAFVHLGFRNGRRHARRSLGTITLIASATFVITAMQAFRIDATLDTGDRNSGTGGFSLVASSSAPLMHDLSTVSGRDRLGFSQPIASILDGVDVFAFRLRDGEESSCLNPYRPTEPRIIGASGRMIDRSGFAFAGTLASEESEHENPWTLLRKTFPDGAIPVIGDEAAVKWQLHSGLGQDFAVTDERGRKVTLRFVALLRGSALQDELIVSEAYFKRVYPSVAGYGFFLVDAPQDSATDVSTYFERELSGFGFDAESTTERLASYAAVQNTYLSTFQTLGGLGLVLGTLGLGAVMLRNVWERRGELALMRAIGLSNAAVGLVVLSENTSLVAVGLLTGAIPAAIAVAPNLLTRGGSFPWVSVGGTLLAVLVVGTASGIVALVPTFRERPGFALRNQ